MGKKLLVGRTQRDDINQDGGTSWSGLKRVGFRTAVQRPVFGSRPIPPMDVQYPSVVGITTSLECAVEDPGVSGETK